MEQAIEIPVALIKLERMRARAWPHLAAQREMQDRVNSLVEQIRVLTARNHELSHAYAGGHAAPGAVYSSDMISKNKRTIAALQAMLTVAKSAKDAHHERNDEFRIYETTRKHLLGELKAWGIE